MPQGPDLAQKYDIRDANDCQLRTYGVKLGKIFHRRLILPEMSVNLMVV